MRAGIQLLLPGLFDLPLQDLEPGFVEEALPGLNRFLGLARTVENRHFDLDEMLRGALGLSGQTASLPVAAAFADAGSEASRLLLAEAIHLHADMHNAIAMPIARDAENLADINALMDGLGELFHEDFDIQQSLPGRYLLTLRGFDAPAHYPHPLSVLGKSINVYIEQSRQVLPWYRLQNEIQMFLHQHPVNQRRLESGKLPINSLWFWGAGRASGQAEPVCWYGDDAELNQFARHVGCQIEPTSQFSSARPDSAAVVVDLRLLQWLKAGYDASLEDLLKDIETGLMAPAMARLADTAWPLRLRAGFPLDFELAPLARFKFWRRPRSLAAWQQMRGIDESEVPA